MKIGVIGVGAIGGTIAQKLADADHAVKVANSRGKDSLNDFAAQIGANPSDLGEISEDAEVLIISIPTPAISDLPESIFEKLPEDAIVVDTGNYYPEMRDNKIEEIENGEIESVWVSKIIKRPVIKAFNTLLAHSLAELGCVKGSENRLAMQIAGDSEKQKEIVSDLIDQCGFDTYDAGDLSESWKMQPCSAGYCCDYSLEELKSVKEKSNQTPESVSKNRAKVMGNFAELTGGDFSHENVIKMNRKYNI